MIRMFVLLSCILYLWAIDPYLEPIYYWRDFDGGKAPSDAIPGGYEEDGHITYIGGVIMRNGHGFVVGNLYPTRYAVAVYDDGRSYSAHTHFWHIQILCSRCQQRLRWVKTNVAGFDFVNGTVVRAGTEHDWHMYVGRAPVGNELRVGKIIRDKGSDRGLQLYDNIKAGKRVILQNFEVLVFTNPPTA